VNIKTTRFGDLEVNEKDIIKFEEGILGFEKLKQFFIVDPGDQTLILWLQSVEKPEMALPIIEPKIFKPDYIVKLVPLEMASLKLETLNEASVYSILTIPSEPTEMTANLKAPIIINNNTNKARQIVLQDNKLDLKLKMYKNLRSYITSFSSDDSKRTNVTPSNGATEVTDTINNSKEKPTPSRRPDLNA